MAVNIKLFPQHEQAAKGDLQASARDAITVRTQGHLALFQFQRAPEPVRRLLTETDRARVATFDQRVTTP